MTEFVVREQLVQVAVVVDAPNVTGAAAQPLIREAIDRSFELPTALYVATVACYFGFLAVMGAAFMNPGLALPMVAFVISIIGGFGLGAKWVRMQPENHQRPLSYGRFRNRGIQIATGHLDGGSAMVQVLILPVLILLWGIAVVVIHAFV